MMDVMGMRRAAVRMLVWGAGIWLLLAGHPLAAIGLWAIVTAGASRDAVKAARSLRPHDAPELADDGEDYVRGCQHQAAVEVRREPVPAVGIEADVVAWYCPPPCDTQLPASFVPRPAVVFPVPVDVEGLTAGQARRQCGRDRASARQIIYAAQAEGRGLTPAEDRTVGALIDRMADLRRHAAAAEQRDELRARAAAALGVTMAEASENIREAFTRRTRYETVEQIEAAGYEPVEVTALGDAESLFVRGKHRPVQLSPQKAAEATELAGWSHDDVQGCWVLSDAADNVLGAVPDNMLSSLTAVRECQSRFGSVPPPMRPALIGPCCPDCGSTHRPPDPCGRSWG